MSFEKKTKTNEREKKNLVTYKKMLSDVFISFYEDDVDEVLFFGVQKNFY